MCDDDGTPFGATNANGLIQFRVPGASTPGCGFTPHCQVAYFRMQDNGVGRPFWFARFIRGEPVSETDAIVALVEGDN